MKLMLKRRRQEDRGVLTFEWVLLITILVIGVVGGLSAVRDSLLTELGDVTEGVISLDQSYSVLDPWDVQLPDCEVDSASGSNYQDSAGMSQSRVGVYRHQSQGIAQCSDFIETPRPRPR